MTKIATVVKNVVKLKFSFSAIVEKINHIFCQETDLRHLSNCHRSAIVGKSINLTSGQETDLGQLSDKSTTFGMRINLTFDQEADL